MGRLLRERVGAWGEGGGEGEDGGGEGCGVGAELDTEKKPEYVVHLSMLEIGRESLLTSHVSSHHILQVLLPLLTQGEDRPPREIRDRPRAVRGRAG